MKFALLIVILGAFLSQSIAQNVSTVEAKAIAYVYTNKLLIPKIMQACPYYYPKETESFKFTDYLWFLNNFPEILVANTYWPLIPEKEKNEAIQESAQKEKRMANEFQSGNDESRIDKCFKYVTDITNGDLHFRKTEPIHSKTLQDIFLKSKTFRNAKHSADLSAGCMVKLWNLGSRIFDLAKRQCDCVNKAILDKVSHEELDQWVHLLETKPEHENSLVFNQPWFKRVAPGIAACTKRDSKLQ